jgi:hypothetical protein
MRSVSQPLRFLVPTLRFLLVVLTVCSLSASAQEDKKKKELILPVQDKPAELKPVSASANDPRVDLYLARLNTKAFFPLRRRAYIRQISEVFLYSPKYRLVVTDSWLAKKMEHQLNIDITKTRGGFFVKATIVSNGKEVESKTLKAKNRRRDVLKTFRQTLNLLLLGEMNYKMEQLKFDKLTRVSVNKAMRIPPPRRPPPPPKPKNKKKPEPKKEDIAKFKIDEQELKKVDEDSGGKEGKTDDSTDLANGKGKDGEEVEKGTDWSWLEGFPRIFVKASQVIGDPISGLIPEKQGVNTTELSFGLNKTNWGTAIGYYSRTYILQTLDTITASQKLTEIRLHQDIIGFNLFFDGKSRVHSKDQKAMYIGLSLGTGTISFEGERIEELGYQDQTIGFYSVGPFLNILGLVQLEASYMTFTEEPIRGLRMADQYPAMVLRFSVGYPL